MGEKDGGPAFPSPLVEWPNGAIDPAYYGMSLRDWFAGMALQGLLAHASGENPHKAPALAIELADAMLAEKGE